MAYHTLHEPNKAPERVHLVPVVQQQKHRPEIAHALHVPELGPAHVFEVRHVRCEHARELAQVPVNVPRVARCRQCRVAGPTHAVHQHILFVLVGRERVVLVVVVRVGGFGGNHGCRCCLRCGRSDGERGDRGRRVERVVAVGADHVLDDSVPPVVPRLPFGRRQSGRRKSGPALHERIIRGTEVYAVN
ncbi:hypothetical protein BC828DRAFT_94059 [Blastocladiella britannica]|nr:hypothetical protein BC828DRAFT_94059 [Blastocladiella britannica]